MPVQTIRDPKTGEERKVYVLPTGMGADAEAPKPQPKPQAPGGFLGTINDLNPIKQISALGSGVSTFLQTGDLNKGIAAAQKESMATTGLGRSVERVGRVGAQRAVDAARYEVDRARLAREQIAAGTSPMNVKVPSTGPAAPSAQRVRLPQWMGYDGIQEAPKNPVEDVAANILAFVPYFAVAGKAGAPVNALARTLPGVGKVATGFEAATTGLKAASGLKKVAGVFAEEAVSGAIPSAIATYYAQKPTDKTLSDGLYDVVKGSPFEGIVAKGLLIDPNDTVEQARVKQSINDLVWSVPLGGTLGTGFRGIGPMAGATKRALAEVLHGTVKVAQADAVAKEAVEAATTGTPAAAAAPGAPVPTAAPVPRVVPGKRTFSSQTYQGLRRQPMWEKTGVETQNVLEPQARQGAPAAPAPQTLPVEAWAPRLNYSDINPAASPAPTPSGKRYAEALAGQDQVAIEATSQKLRASFNNAAAKLGIELGPNAGSQSWSLWDIGKQLYMNANPAKSNKPYVLGNPLSNVQVQSDIVDRMLGFELTQGFDAEGKRWKSWQLTQIGRKARKDAGIELGLLPDRGPQQPRKAPPTPEVAAAALKQAQADLVTSTQRLQTEAAREMVTAPEAAAVPEGQLPGMNQPAYGQTGPIATKDLAVAPKVFQYKAEGQFSATGQSGSLAQEDVYDPVYAGVVTVWRDKLGELGPVGQVYIANGHNRYDLALRSGAQFMNVLFVDAPTAADARVVGALQNIKDEKGTAIDAGKLFRDTGMSIEELRLQNVTLSGKLVSEGIALSRLPQWLFDKAATGDLSSSVAVALGSAGDIDEAIISDVAKQALKSKWAAEKVVQAMQEAKFASAGAGPTEGVLPGFEEMFKSTDVVALIDVRTAAYKALSVEMRALVGASRAKNTPFLEAAGNVIDVEGSQAARRLAAESVAVFNRVTGYEGPVRAVLNELAAQLPGGKNQEKAAASLVQFNLQRLRDAISEEMHGPKLPMTPSVPSAGTSAAAAPPAAPEPRTAVQPMGNVAAAAIEPPTAAAAPTRPTIDIPESAGNPAPIQAAPASPALRAAPDPAENRAIATALEAHDRAIETGDTQAAGDIGAWLERRGVKPVAMPEAPAPAVVPGPAGMARAKAANLPVSAVRAASTPGLVKAAANRLVDMGIARNLDEAMARAEDAGVLTDAGALLKLFSGNDDELKGAQLQLQRMGSATWGNEIDQPPVAKLRAAMEAIYPPAGSRGTDFSAELPNVSGWQSVETGAGGTVGEGYTGATRITDAQASELARIAYNISGVTDFEILNRIEVVYKEKQARAYGDMGRVGQTAEVAGTYAPGTVFGKSMAEDQIRVAMTAYGATKTFTQMLSTTYHESFHRLQRWFLNEKEQFILARGEKAIRELAAQKAEANGQPGYAGRFRDGTINLKESQAEGFAAYMQGFGKAPIEGFAKLKKLVDQTINGLLTFGEFKTWDDVFEKAALGEIKDRGPAGGADDGVQFAADPPDPAEFARRIDQNMQALESGQLEPEEIARMGASDVRRITSRSGNTQYVPGAPNELIASNRALGEMLTSRAQQTGIESYSQPAIVKAALDQLDRDGWAVESTVTRLEAARSGDPKSQDDLVALAANVIHRDYLAAQNGMTAIEWQSAVDDGDRAVSMQRLWAGLEDQHKLDTALMTATRKDGQRLSVMQIRHQIDPTHRTLPTGTVLYHGTSQEAAQAIVDTGFQPSNARSNLLGTGVYFAEDLFYAGAYGESAAGGDVPSDIRILDMVAMDRRIADLVQELNLGPLQKRGGELYMTEAQKVGVRDWATGQGYSGIRFSPDFEMREGAAPETVIYDVNVANRIVGSKAAVEPEVPRSNESMAADIENEIADPVNTLLGKLDPEIRAGIEEGNLTPEVVGLTDTLSRLSVEGRDNPGHRAKFNSMVKRVDVNRLNQEMVGQMFISSLLWSVGTPAKMLLGSAYRATTMPLSQALGELATAGASAAVRDKVAMEQALRKAGLDMQMYGKMVTNLSNTFRLIGYSLKEGEAFGNLGVTSQDLVRRKLTPGDKQMSMFTDPEDPTNTLDNPWWLNPENKNIPALGVRWSWQLLNTSSRVAGSIDTLFSSMMGPSAEWSRIMDLELTKANGRGLVGQEAWDAASKITEDRIESQWVDVAVNGKMIQNGAFTGVHAKNAMDWINFTDPLEVDFQPRSFEYGVIKAKEEGLTDVAEINRRAMAWVEEEPPAMAKLGMGVGQAVTLPAKLLKDAVGHVPVLRILHSFPTSPVNIGKASMRGYGFTAPFADTFWRDIYSEDRGTRSRAIGEVAIAHATLAFGAALANSGFVEFSGPGTYNSQVRDKMSRLGIEPYSIRFKNPYNGWKSKWWNLQAFDTTSNMFAIIGLIQNTGNSIPKEDLEALTSNAILGAMEFGRQIGFAQFSKDMNKSLGEIANLISDLQNRSFIPVEGQIDPYSSYIERRLSGFMPAIFNVARKGADPYQRAIEKSTLPQPIAFIHELGERLANRVPGLSGTLPPILHPMTAEPMLISGTWGLEFIPADQPWLRAMINAASPLGFTTGKAGSDDPVDIELGRLSGRGAQFQIWSPREFSEVANYRLNQVQLNKLAVITSQLVPPGRNATLHQSLSAMVAPNSTYWQLPAPEPSKVTSSARVIRINKEINVYKPFIREAFLATEPKLANMLAEQKNTKAQAEYEATYGTGSPWSPTPR
jgi:hypothetical protein